MRLGDIFLSIFYASASCGTYFLMFPNITPMSLSIIGVGFIVMFIFWLKFFSQLDNKLNTANAKEQANYEEVTKLLEKNPTVQQVLQLVDNPKKSKYVRTNQVLDICLRQLDFAKSDIDALGIRLGQTQADLQDLRVWAHQQKSQTVASKSTKSLKKKKELSLKETLKKLPTTSTLKPRTKVKGKKK